MAAEGQPEDLDLVVVPSWDVDVVDVTDDEAVEVHETFVELVAEDALSCEENEAVRLGAALP